MSDRTERPSGVVSARTVGAARILRRRAQSARAASRQFPKDSQDAAALRGKARGLDQAADLIDRLERGLPLNGKQDRLLRRAAS